MTPNRHVVAQELVDANDDDAPADSTAVSDRTDTESNPENDDLDRDDESEIDVQIGQDATLELLDQAVAAIGGTVRTGQRTMCAEVARAIAGDTNLIVQAGTGTGKSLGYLVPAVLAARQARVVVATATLGLQRQLITKDMPTLERLLRAKKQPVPTVAVLKGWNHYLCKARLEGVYPADALFAIDAVAPSSKVMKSLRRLREWDTVTGDRDELQPGVSDRIWRQVSVARNRCVGTRCQFHDECFAVAARERAADADIVITNHAIMGVAATSNPLIIGDADVVIADEGHALAEHVRSQATVTLSITALRALARAVATASGVQSDTLPDAIAVLAQTLEELPEGLLDQIPAELIDACSLFDSALREAASLLSDHKDATAQMVKAELRESQQMGDAAIDPKLVRWVEKRTEEPQLVCAPLVVADRIRSRFADQGRMIITSATLTAGGSFDAIAASCGLQHAQKPWKGLDVGSPFEYPKRGISYVAADLPAPSVPGMSDLAKRRLLQLIEASGGGALSLFSSYRAMEDAYAYLQEHSDLEYLMQGDGQLSTLIDTFVAERDTNLLGTLSLWQGIDAPGMTCRLVTIDRIPFPHPANPMIQARNRAVEAKGMSSFAAVSLPHAGLLLSQGAGRLIRNAEDRGVLALLDSRLVHKSYGSYLRRDLPKLWPTTDLKTVIAALERLRDELD